MQHITILKVSKKRAPNKKLTPGAILVLHTFGNDLKWNPHIHYLITEGATSNVYNCPNNDIWINFSHFNYELLRKSFQYCLLKNLKIELKKVLSRNEFAKYIKLKNYLYQNYDNRFYVRAKPFEGKSSTNAINYLFRYFNRLSMAQARILHYEEDYIVFFYRRHEDDVFVIKKIHVYELFKLLIIHIPDKNFKMLRYLGIYTSHKCLTYKNLKKKMSEISISIAKRISKWPLRISKFFHYDPLNCPYCNTTMKLSSLHITKNTN